MACLTIRNLEDGLKVRLRLRAAQHGCSMEAEVRNILAQSLMSPSDSGSLVTRIRQRFAAVGTEALPIPSRRAVRTPPDLGE